jgi:hypothetical protein
VSRPFSITDVAFDGFRLIGREWRAVLVWALVGAALWIGLMALFFLVGWPMMADVMDAAWRGSPMGWREIAPRLPGLVLFQLASLAVYAMAIGLFLNAIARAILHPDERRSAYLRLGADEARTGGAYLVLMLLAIGVMAAAAGFVGLLYLLTRDLMIIPLAAPLAFFAVWGVWVWGSVRLSLLLPRTFDTGRIDLPAAWRLTRGSFWPLLGLGLLVYLLSMLISFLAQPLMLVFMPWMMMTLPSTPDATVDPREIMQQMAPMMVGMFALMMPIVLAQAVVTYAPFVAAYRALSATPPRPDAAPSVPAG